MISVSKETKDVLVKSFPEGSFSRNKLDETFDKLQATFTSDFINCSDPNYLLKLSGMMQATDAIRKLFTP